MGPIKVIEDTAITAAIPPAVDPPLSLSARYADFFDMVADAQPWYQHIYFMALDAEWFEVAQRNIVLSYQVATVSSEEDNNIIEYMSPGQRLTLAEIVDLGIRSVNGGDLPDSHYSDRTLVILISHHVTAEWSVLADRKEPHITKKIVEIRKSPVTGIVPIKLDIDNGCRTNVHIYDTRLLAPATNQKLSELSKLLGNDNDLKIEISHYYKKRMNLFRRDYPEDFEKYALQDSKVTLKLFFLLQKGLMDLAETKKLYRTLASAAVTGYLCPELTGARNYQAYQTVLNSKKFDAPYRLVKRGYIGGRNEGFFVGRSDSRHNPESANRLWVDVDFVGCYPTAMALCPLIDCGIDPFSEKIESDILTDILGSSAKVDQIPLTYSLEARNDDQIMELGINPKFYNMAKDAQHSQYDGPPIKRSLRTDKDKDFDEILAVISKNKGGKAQAERIRKEALKVDNRLIDKWHQTWITAKKHGNRNIERYIIPGVARIRFNFEGKTAYPCLPVPHVKYGLIFPMAGETVATAPEIMLALDAGAKIEALSSVELPMVYGDDGLPKGLFFDHLARLTKMRAAEKRKIADKSLSTEERNNSAVYERLLKEFLNSFYGKSAQAINFRKTYNASTGEMKPLGISLITEPSAAALTTGLARAALGAVLLAIERFNAGKPIERQILIVSDTTDGVLIGLPRPEGINLLDGHYYKQKDNGIKFNDDEVKLPDILNVCGCADLMDMITSYLPIRQMRRSRLELTRPDDSTLDAAKPLNPDHGYQSTGNDTFLEVKNLADEVFSVKTRGQIGWIKDGDNIAAITILAKFGHKPPLSEIVMMGTDQAQLTVEQIKEREEAYQKLYEGGGTNRHTTEGNWIMQQMDRIEKGEEDIFEYTFFGLTGFNEIMKNDEEGDLVQKIGSRRFNGDFDWKRKLVKKADGTIDPVSIPFADIHEMITYRHQMQAERRRGKNARPDKVIHRVETRARNTRMRGGEPATVVRLFLRGILHGFIPWERNRRTSVCIAEHLNSVWHEQGYTLQERSPERRTRKEDPSKSGLIEKTGKGETPERPIKCAFSRNDIENAQRFNRAEWEAGVIMATPQLLSLADALAQEFGVDPVEVHTQLFSSNEYESITRELALQVVRAVLHAPGLGISPFNELYRCGQLDRNDLVRAMRPHLTERDVEACRSDTFHTNSCNAMDRPRIELLFRRLGIPVGKAKACARVMAPPIPRTSTAPHNPAEKKCMEQYIQAVMQPDIVQRSIDPSQLVDKLRWYGLKKSQLYSLIKRKFVPRSLSDTPGNRRQIAKMANSMDLDPAPIVDALIGR